MGAHSLAGGDALRGGGGGVLGRVLQPLDHLALDRGADGGLRGVAQVLGGPLQGVLALAVIGARSAELGRLDHFGGGVGELLCRREESLLQRRSVEQKRGEGGEGKEKKERKPRLAT